MKNFFLIFFLCNLIFFVFFLTKKSLPIANEKKDHSFVIIISAHNAEKMAEKTLASILNQTYKNYRVIYIDDGSKDKTKKLVQTFIQKKDLERKITFLHFKKPKGSLIRTYRAALNTQDDEIIIFLDEKAFLNKKDHLTQINEKFKNFAIWLLYGPSFNEKTKRLEKAYAISPKKLFTYNARSIFWKPSLFKAFYSFLLKKIEIKDFFFQENFLQTNNDVLYMFPLLEMANDHTLYSKEALCHFYPQKRNSPCFFAFSKKNPLLKNRFSKPYPPLKTPLCKSKKMKKADLIIFSYHRPLQLYALLESLEKYVKGVEKISVIYRCDEKSFEKGYQKVAEKFKNVVFIKQSLHHPKEDFKPLLLDVIRSSHDYVFFAVDDILFKDFVNIDFCLSYLENTKSYFFSLRLAKHINYCYMGNYKMPLPPFVKIADDIMGWQIAKAKGDWCYPTSVDVTIYRKKDILQDFSQISFINPNTLEINWHNFYKKTQQEKKSAHIGLCFTKSKAINIPLNLVNISENRTMDLFSAQELLEKFNNNFIMDISHLEKIENKSVHIEIKPKFIKR